MHAVSLNPLNPTKLAAILQMRKQAWGGPANVWGCTLVEWQSLGLSLRFGLPAVRWVWGSSVLIRAWLCLSVALLLLTFTLKSLSLMLGL